MNAAETPLILPTLPTVLAEPESPEAVALNLLIEHRIVQKALPALVERVKADPALLSAVMDQVLEFQCRRVLETVGHMRHQEEKRRTGGARLAPSVRPT